MDGPTCQRVPVRQPGFACVRAYNDLMVEASCGESGGQPIPLGLQQASAVVRAAALVESTHRHPPLGQKELARLCIAAADQLVNRSPTQDSRPLQGAGRPGMVSRARCTTNRQQGEGGRPCRTTTDPRCRAGAGTHWPRPALDTPP